MSVTASRVASLAPRTTTARQSRKERSRRPGSARRGSCRSGCGGVAPFGKVGGSIASTVSYPGAIVLSHAGVAELADATGLGPVGRKPLEVRVLSPPFLFPPCPPRARRPGGAPRPWGQRAMVGPSGAPLRRFSSAARPGLAALRRFRSRGKSSEEGSVSCRSPWSAWHATRLSFEKSTSGSKSSLKPTRPSSCASAATLSASRRSS